MILTHYRRSAGRSEVSLAGKVGLVTGGGQGIGKGIVKRLLEEGMSVVIAEIDEEAGRETEIRAETSGSRSLHSDRCAG